MREIPINKFKENSTNGFLRSRLERMPLWHQQSRILKKMVITSFKMVPKTSRY